MTIMIFSMERLMSNKEDLSPNTPVQLTTTFGVLQAIGMQLTNGVYREVAPLLNELQNFKEIKDGNNQEKSE